MQADRRQGPQRTSKPRSRQRDSSAKLCGARTRSGGTCRNPVMRGGKRCRMHGGSSPQAKKAAARRVAERKVVTTLERMGVAIQVDPLEALLGQVYESAGNVAVLRGLILQLEPKVSGWNDEADSAGIAGPNHLGDGAPHVLVTMYDRERDRLANMVKLCLDADVAERRVALAEHQGELLAQVIRGILGDLKLSKGQRDKVPGIVRRHLTAVAGGAA
jgi:hypothetical protein